MTEISGLDLHLGAPGLSDHLGSLADADRRSAALQAAADADAPSSEEEEWRYSPIGDLDLSAWSPQLAAPSVDIAPAPDGSWAAVVDVVNGWVVAIDLDDGWASKGLAVETDELIGRTITAPDAGQLDQLHMALAPAALRISVPAGMSVTDPVLVRSHHTGEGVASFAHSIASVGADGEIVIVERQTSAEGAVLAAPLLELDVASAGRLRWVTVQELGADAWQLGRLVSSAGDQSTLFTGIAAFGGAYARVRTDTTLDGRGSTGELVAVYYGDGEQIHDFRTFQHHKAGDTLSDLLFKGAADDEAGSIYTGLIEIHEEGAGSNAHQTNRNVKLSEDAWAWSVPNLEIHNNDVRCSHASTVSPVDVDQRFYLHARGVPPMEADRLIVAGFFDEVITRLPNDAVQADVRALIAEKLARRVGGDS